MIISGLTGSGVDNHLVRWDGISNLQSSTAILDDTGNLTGTASILMGQTTWNNVNGIVSTADFNITATSDANFTSNANINFVAFTGQVNLVADQDCTFGSVSGAFLLTAGTTGLFETSGDLQFTSDNGNVGLSAPTGAIFINNDAIFSGAAVHQGNSIFLGAGNEGSLMHDGTALVINPKLSGTSDVVIGSSSASGGNDANLRVNRLAVFGSDTLGTSAINCVVTGALRTALNFVLTFNSGTVSAPLQCNLIDVSTGSNITMTSTLEYTLNSTSHTATDATKASVLNISNGINAGIAINVPTATTQNHYFTCLKLAPNSKGVGGTHSVTGSGILNFYSTGLFQKKMSTFTAAAGITSTYVGSYWGDDVCLQNDTKLIFDNTETDSTTLVAVTKGTTDMAWISASSLLRTRISGTTALESTTTANFSKLNLKLDQVGTGLYVKEGTNATMGVATLVAGTVVVNTTKVTANSRIFLTHNTAGGTVGAVSVSARTAGTSFTITSLNILDTSNIAWIIMEPA